MATTIEIDEHNLIIWLEGADRIRALKTRLEIPWAHVLSAHWSRHDCLREAPVMYGLIPGVETSPVSD